MLHHGRDIDHAGDIRSAAADKNTDAGRLASGIDLHRGLFFSGQAPASINQVAAGAAGRGASLDDRRGDILRTFESAAHINAGPGGLDRVKATGDGKAIVVRANVECGRQLGRRFVDPQPHGEHHNVEHFFHPPAGFIEIPDHQLVIFNRNDMGDLGLDKTHPGFIPSPVVKLFKIFSMGADIHIKDSGIERLLAVFLGQHGLFDRIGAAN